MGHSDIVKILIQAGSHVPLLPCCMTTAVTIVRSIVRSDKSELNCSMLKLKNKKFYAFFNSAIAVFTLMIIKQSSDREPIGSLNFIMYIVRSH